MNTKYCECLRQHVDTPVVHGDINDTAVLTQVIQHSHASHVVSGGFSCQPFSALGDPKEGSDSRSASLPGILQLAFHSRPFWVILECTKEVRESEWAQGTLKQFCNDAGYQMTQNVLDLHKI